MEVDHTTAVTALVVILADKLDKVLVGDTGLGIEDGGVGVAVRVSGDDIILDVGEDSWTRSALGGSYKWSIFRKRRGVGG